jgi:hypothetical protein
MAENKAPMARVTEICSSVHVNFKLGNFILGFHSSELYMSNEKMKMIAER